MSERSVEYVALADVVPADVNPKSHAEKDLDASLARWGYTEPVLLDERTGKLVAGHGRLAGLVAREARGAEPPDGVTVGEDGRWQIPVVRGWASKDDAEASAYLVASNRLTTLGGWDDEALAKMLVSVQETPLALDGVGYTSEDLAALLVSLEPVADPKGNVDPDDVPEPPKVPVTQPGDLWLLGDHRLVCGDCREGDSFDRVLGGEHLTGTVVADPPYGVAIGAKNRALDSIDRAGRVLTDLDGDQGIEEVEALWKASFGAIHTAIPPGCPYYIFGPQGGDLGLLLLLLRDSGLMPRHILIWMKNRASFSIGRLDYDYQHEPIVYGWKPGGPHPWHSTETCTSILQFDRPAASPLHPTMKPVDLLAYLITNSTQRGEIVLDPFGGSGSSMIAAHSVGRRGFLIEIDPHYCDVICERFQRFTGIVPTRDGVPFDFIAHAEAAA